MRLLSLLFAVSTSALAAAEPPSAAQRSQFLDLWINEQHQHSGKPLPLPEELQEYPLYPYLEAASLSRDLEHADSSQVAQFLVRNEGTRVGIELRRDWLKMLGNHRRFKEFRSSWREADLNQPELACLEAAARIAENNVADLASRLDPLWKKGESLPAACDEAMAWLAGHGYDSSDKLWQRLEAATRARSLAVAQQAAGRLPAAEQAEAQRWLQLLADPGATLKSAAAWSDTERTRRLLEISLLRIATKNGEQAATLWSTLSAHFAFDARQRAAVIGAIALDKAASYSADAAQWLARVPDPISDPRIGEWRVRVALNNGDYAAALLALDRFDPSLSSDSHWHYLKARLLQLTGQAKAAQAEFETAAASTNFHGFLAADQAGRPYQLCGQEIAAADPARAGLASLPGVVRSFEWLALERRSEARREWATMLDALNPAQRRAATAIAMEHGWLERGPLDLLGADDLRYYTLRFPLGEKTAVEEQASRRGLDPALVFGLIRAESAWMADAHSVADARGLMQLLPGVGLALAKREKIRVGSAQDLYRPEINLQLGTVHLRDALNALDGRVDLAAATYNAGPAPVARWRKARPDLPADLWIETIPYRETRDYVARVLAFAVIYDWRLYGSTTAVSERMGLAEPSGKRRAITCPIAKLASNAP